MFQLQPQKPSLAPSYPWDKIQDALPGFHGPTSFGLSLPVHLFLSLLQLNGLRGIPRHILTIPMQVRGLKTIRLLLIKIPLHIFQKGAQVSESCPSLTFLLLLNYSSDSYLYCCYPTSSCGPTISVSSTISTFPFNTVNSWKVAKG